MAIAKAADAMLGTGGAPPKLLRTVVTAYAALVANVGVDEPGTKRQLRSQAVRLGGELGLDYEAVGKEIDLVDKALTSEINAAAKALGKAKKPRVK